MSGRGGVGRRGSRPAVNPSVFFECCGDHRDLHSFPTRRSSDLAIADIGEIIHGTTLVTNAIIERRGAKVGLLTTQGFRDVLEMGTEQRYDIYDLFLRFPAPLVPRRRRIEIAERMDARGRVVT